MTRTYLHDSATHAHASSQLFFLNFLFVSFAFGLHASIIINMKEIEVKLSKPEHDGM